MIDKYFSKYENLITPNVHSLNKIISQTSSLSNSIINDIPDNSNIKSSRPSQKNNKQPRSQADNKKINRCSTPGNNNLFIKHSNVNSLIEINENNIANSIDNYTIQTRNQNSTVSNQMIGDSQNEFIINNNSNNSNNNLQEIIMQLKKTNMFLRNDIINLKSTIKKLTNEKEILNFELNKQKDNESKSESYICQLEGIIDKLRKEIKENKEKNKNKSRSQSSKKACDKSNNSNINNIEGNANANNLIVQKNNINCSEFITSVNSCENSCLFNLKNDYNYNYLQNLKEENERLKKFYDDIYLISNESKLINIKAINAFKEILVLFDSLNNFYKENNYTQVNININQEQFYLQNIKKPTEEIINCLIQDNFLRKEEYKILLEEKDKTIFDLKNIISDQEEKIKNLINERNEKENKISSLENEYLNNIQNEIENNKLIDECNNNFNCFSQDISLNNNLIYDNMNIDSSSKKSKVQNKKNKKNCKINSCDNSYAGTHRQKNINKSSSTLNMKIKPGMLNCNTNGNFHSNCNLYDKYKDKSKNRKMLVKNANSLNQSQDKGNNNNFMLMNNNLINTNEDSVLDKYSVLKNNSRSISKIEKIECQ